MRVQQCHAYTLGSWNSTNFSIFPFQMRSDQQKGSMSCQKNSSSQWDLSSYGIGMFTAKPESQQALGRKFSAVNSKYKQAMWDIQESMDHTQRESSLFIRGGVKGHLEKGVDGGKRPRKFQHKQFFLLKRNWKNRGQWVAPDSVREAKREREQQQ